MLIKIGMDIVEIVELWQGKRYCRGKDKSGSVYQFTEEQIYER